MSKPGESPNNSGRIAAQDPAAAAAAAAAAAYALSSASGRSPSGQQTGSTAMPASNGGNSGLAKGKITYANVPRGQASAIAYIKYASLDKLVEKLTDDKESDFVFKNAFVLCYKSFCTAAEFAQALVERFMSVSNEARGGRAVPPALAARNSVLQLKVLSMMSFWMKKDFSRADILNDPDAKDILSTFLTKVIENYGAGQKNIATTLLDLLNQWAADARMESFGTDLERKSTEIDLSQLDLSEGRSNSPVTSFGSPQDFEDSSTFDQSGFATIENGTESEVDNGKEAQPARAKPQGTIASPADNDMPVSISSDGDNLLHESFSHASTDMGSSYEGKGFSSSSTTEATSLASLASLKDVGSPNESAARSTSSRSSSTSKDSKLSKSSHRLKPLIGLPAEQVAEQLTFSEMDHYFMRIQPREFTNKAWTREEIKKKEARHIVRMIEVFNARTNWVASEVLHPKLETADRAKVISFFIDVAETCRRLNNFNTLVEIVSGLKNPCLAQLHNTWTLVSQPRLERFAVLQQLISPENNYAQYRQAVALCDGQPCIPCLLVVTKDLFSLEEGMPTIEGGLIHFAKFRKIYETISAFLSFQEQPYTIVKYEPGSRSRSKPASSKTVVILRTDEKLQKLLKTRMKYFQKSKVDLWRLAKHANTQESITFVNSINEAGFL